MNLLLTLSLALVAQSAQFVDEDGFVIPLDQGPIQADVAGLLYVPFPFQSNTMDAATGLYLEPDLYTCFLVEPASGMPQQVTRIFGGPFLGPSPEITDFDPVTGQGSALAKLRFNRVDSQTAWAHFWDGSNSVVLYYGSTPEAVAHDGWNPPALAEGSVPLAIEAQDPEVELAVVANWDLIVGEATQVVVLFDHVATSERVFSVWVAGSPALVPATVTLQPGEDALAFELTPQDPGIGRVYIEEILPDGMAGTASVFHSHAIRVKGARAVMRPIGSSPEGVKNVPESHLTSNCVPARDVTPDGNPDEENGQVEIFCTKCKSSASLDDCASLDGPVAFVREAKCVWTINLTSNCTLRAGASQMKVSAWEYVADSSSIWDCLTARIVLQLDGRSIAGWVWRRYRACCVYEKVDSQNAFVNVRRCD